VRICLLVALLGSMAGVPAAAQTSPRDHVEAMRHLRLGQAEMREERWAKAEAELKDAVKLEPSLEMAHYGLGQVYMATKRYPAAVAAYLGCRGAWMANISARASNDLLAQRQLDDQIRALEDEKTLLATGRVKAMFSAG